MTTSDRRTPESWPLASARMCTTNSFVPTQRSCYYILRKQLLCTNSHFISKCTVSQKHNCCGALILKFPQSSLPRPPMSGQVWGSHGCRVIMGSSLTGPLLGWCQTLQRDTCWPKCSIAWCSHLEFVIGTLSFLTWLCFILECTEVFLPKSLIHTCRL